LSVAVEKLTSNFMSFSGYPRNLERLHFFQQNLSPIHKVIYLRCSDEVLKQRLRLGSRGRADDNSEAIQKRVDTFRRETILVLDEVKRKKDTCFEVDGEESPLLVKEKISEIITLFL